MDNFTDIILYFKNKNISTVILYLKLIKYESKAIYCKIRVTIKKTREKKVEDCTGQKQFSQKKGQISQNSEITFTHPIQLWATLQPNYSDYKSAMFKSVVLLYCTLVQLFILCSPLATEAFSDEAKLYLGFPEEHVQNDRHLDCHW